MDVPDKHNGQQQGDGLTWRCTRRRFFCTSQRPGGTTHVSGLVTCVTLTWTLPKLEKVRKTTNIVRAYIFSIFSVLVCIPEGINHCESYTHYPRHSWTFALLRGSWGNASFLSFLRHPRGHEAVAPSRDGGHGGHDGRDGHSPSQQHPRPPGPPGSTGCCHGRKGGLKSLEPRESRDGKMCLKTPWF